MKNHHLIAFLIASLLVAGLAGCKRAIPGSASGPEALGGNSVPQTGATDVLDQIYLFATQTAMATQGLTTPLPSSLDTSLPGAENTSLAPGDAVTQDEPAVPTATPRPQIPWNPTPGIPSSYTLHTGEFPYCIARRFNVEPGALLTANGLTTYSVYYNGMVLTIPQNTRGFPGSRALKPHPAVYTVRSGDTIFTIACDFGDVDPDAIIFVNSLDASGKISPGQELQIP